MITPKSSYLGQLQKVSGAEFAEELDLQIGDVFELPTAISEDGESDKIVVNA